MDAEIVSARPGVSQAPASIDADPIEQLTNTRWHFDHTAWPQVQGLERHFGCPLLCGGPRNAIGFRAADAQRLFATRHAELLATLAPQFEEKLKRENGDENFVERVRGAIE